MRIFCCIYSVKSGNFTKTVKFPMDSQLSSLHLHFALSKLIHPKAKYRSNFKFHQTWLISAKMFYSGVMRIGDTFSMIQIFKEVLRYVLWKCTHQGILRNLENSLIGQFFQAYFLLYLFCQIREFYKICKIPCGLPITKFASTLCLKQTYTS